MLPTRLTQRRRSAGRGKEFILDIKPTPYPEKICPGCGATTRLGRHCPKCGREISREKLIELAKVGRAAAQSAESRRKHSETQRRHEAAKRAWASSPKANWPDENTYVEKIQPALATVNRDELFGLYQGLREVRDARIHAGDFYRVRMHGNNREYRVLLSVCEMIHRFTLPAEENGTMRFVDFQRDDAKMRKVFQLFVTNFYRRRQTEYNVSIEAFPWSRSMAHHSVPVSLPRLVTDIILADSRVKVVVEVKFGRIFDEQYGKRTLRPSHVNQLFAYLQNVEDRDPKKRAVRGILLYAATEGAFSFDWTLFGKPLRTVAIDLTKEWPEIETQLLGALELCDDMRCAVANG